MQSWKDGITIARDAILLCLLLLLLVWPTKFNDLLVSAGFEEGSIVGFKWKAKLSEFDVALKEAQVTISNLSDQNKKLLAALPPGANVTNQDLVERNAQLTQSVKSVEANAQATIESGAVLVEKAHLAISNNIVWGVVFGGDETLESANYEVNTIANKLNIPNASVYLRNKSYRSVSTTKSREEAEAILYKAKNRRNDSYIVNMNTWCPKLVDVSGYFECQ